MNLTVMSKKQTVDNCSILVSPESCMHKAQGPQEVISKLSMEMVSFTPVNRGETEFIIIYNILTNERH